MKQKEFHFFNNFQNSNLSNENAQIIKNSEENVCHLIWQNGHMTVAFGDKFIDFHPDLRIIIITRDSAIKLPPRESALVSLVTFTMTTLKAGLLTLTLSTELAELEEQHQEKHNESEQLKIELGKLEEGLLDILGRQIQIQFFQINNT